MMLTQAVGQGWATYCLINVVTLLLPQQTHRPKPQIFLPQSFLSIFFAVFAAAHVWSQTRRQCVCVCLNNSMSSAHHQHQHHNHLDHHHQRHHQYHQHQHQHQHQQSNTNTININNTNITPTPSPIPPTPAMTKHLITNTATIKTTIRHHQYHHKQCHQHQHIHKQQHHHHQYCHEHQQHKTKGHKYLELPWGYVFQHGLPGKLWCFWSTANHWSCP